MDAVELTRALVRHETINPPGNERPCAEFLGGILEAAGFSIAYHPMGENRANLIARIGGGGAKKPLCFTGHTDVVPLGAAPWSVPPFAAEIADGKIYGRGATDMKGGVAAFVAAAVELAPRLAGTPGLVLVITAAEESGCEGANHLVSLGGDVLGEAGAMVVAEPTSMRPLIGHKGVLWVEALAKGLTAHGSMPEQGDNAVYKAARVVTRLASLNLAEGRELAAGVPTVNVGWLRGGMNVNSVPDEARFGIDIRMVPGITDSEVMAVLAEIGGPDVSFSRRTYAAPVWTDPADPWMAGVFDLMQALTGARAEPTIASYFTDAAALTGAYGNPPTVILGPGEMEMAHQTDEFCHIHRIQQAKTAYIEITKSWCGL
jgi:succinyl-diaminopimelate desuccinylase